MSSKICVLDPAVVEMVKTKTRNPTLPIVSLIKCPIPLKVLPNQ